MKQPPNILKKLGFTKDFADKAVNYIGILDRKNEIDLNTAPIEVRIISSADGCSHMVGPFLHIFWHEATDMNFPGRTFEQLMELNMCKVDKDWSRKIVLPEARAAFEARYRIIREQSGDLPAKFFA